MHEMPPVAADVTVVWTMASVCRVASHGFDVQTQLN